MRWILVALALAVAACQTAPPTESVLWLPLPATMQKLEYFDFTNNGPETAILKAQPPRTLHGITYVSAGQTVRVFWKNDSYSAELLP